MASVDEKWTWENCRERLLALFERPEFSDGVKLLGYELHRDGSFEDFLEGTGPVNEVRRRQVLYAILTYYSEATVVPLAGRLVKFNQLEGGVAKAKFSDQLERRLAGLFDDWGDAAGRVLVERFGGKKMEYGDASFELEFLPGLPVTFVYHAADEEEGFPSDLKVFFDATANHYLPTEIADYLVDVFAERLERALGAARN
ncbi:MAG: hypothetical protein Kow0069_29910 [Promethearchaeota archaeon]